MDILGLVSLDRMMGLKTHEDGRYQNRSGSMSLVYWWTGKESRRSRPKICWILQRTNHLLSPAHLRYATTTPFVSVVAKANVNWIVAVYYVNNIWGWSGANLLTHLQYLISSRGYVVIDK